ncbi:MAG: hypothetical protein ACREPP_02975 [Rhodanobacteraceae bacterium]
MTTASPMPQELIYSALYSALGLTDSILQIWITLTFAVIVSTYVAGKRFERQVYWLISGLYSLASIVLFTRFVSAAAQAFYYKNLLVARGFEAWPVPNFVSLIIGVGTSVLLVAGTIGTLWFVRATRKTIEALEIS